MKTTYIGDQGEVMIRMVTEGTIPDGCTAFNERDRLGRIILSHSEKGNHHVLDDPDVMVMEQTVGVPAGMRFFYALLDKPTRLIQDAGDGHEPHNLPANLYQFRIRREFDPLMQQARQVAD